MVDGAELSDEASQRCAASKAFTFTPKKGADGVHRFDPEEVQRLQETFPADQCDWLRMASPTRRTTADQ